MGGQAARGRPDAVRLQHPEGVDASPGAPAPRRRRIAWGQGGLRRRAEGRWRQARGRRFHSLGAHRASGSRPSSSSSRRRCPTLCSSRSMWTPTPKPRKHAASHACPPFSSTREATRCTSSRVRRRRRSGRRSQSTSDPAIVLFRHFSSIEIKCNLPRKKKKKRAPPPKKKKKKKKS